MKKQGQLLSCQAAASYLGITKKEVESMVWDGRLRQVKIGDKRYIAAQSIVRILGYDPTGVVKATAADEQYTSLSFEDYAVRLLRRGWKRAGSRTLNNYRQGVCMLSPKIGRQRIAEITEADLFAAFREITGRYAKNSLKLAYASAKIIFGAAYAAGDIPRDPTVSWQMERSKKPEKTEKQKVYSEAEIDRILRESKTYNQELYTMFCVLSCTGMRPGELLGLEWSAFNAEKKTVRIYQVVTRKFGAVQTLHQAPRSKSILSVPKSEYSTRSLRLSDAACEALLAWRAQLRKNKNRARARSRFIFPGRNGRFRSLSGCEAMLQKFRRDRGLGDMQITFYKFRHTMCTRLVRNEQPMSIIQRIMGDNSPNVIARTYTHINEEDMLRAADKLFCSLDAISSER